MTQRLLLLVALFVLAGSGCMDSSSQYASTVRDIPVSVVLATSQSRESGIDPTAVWIRWPEQLDPSLAEQIKANNLAALPWDSATEGALIIFMGRQPSGGYSLSLAAPTARAKRGVAVVEVVYLRPAVGAIVTQVITSPCLVVKLPFEGLNLIRVQDQDGRIRAEAAVRP